VLLARRNLTSMSLRNDACEDRDPKRLPLAIARLGHSLAQLPRRSPQNEKSSAVSGKSNHRPNGPSVRADPSYLLALVAKLLLLGMMVSAARAQTLPSSEQFDGALRICAAGQKIELSADLIGSISNIYNGQRTQGAASFRNSTEFLSIMPEGARLEAYRLYVDCITKILAEAATVTPSPVTVTYRVCSGEYERACQQHDAYLYCYSDVAAWARGRCVSSTIQRINTYGGNKCGYSIDAVICTGPK
jgi:hypothetical protein